MLELLAAAAMTVAGCRAPDEVADQAVVIGRAVSVNQAQKDEVSTRYCEYFLPQGNGAVRVLYFDAQGKKVAEKGLRKTPEGVTESIADDPLPEVVQEDFRRGEIREVKRVKDGWTFRYRKNRESRWQETTVGAPGLDVIDAGFDPFVREHWPALSSGQEIDFGFASPVHQRVIQLRARSVDCRSGIHSPSHLCVEVDLAQPWLRWLAGDIYLVYSSADRRLRYFDGVVNLPDADGSAQSLQIKYFYPSELSR